MKTLFLNPCSGIAGDMFVGALLDLGADTPAFWQQLRSLPIHHEEWSVDSEKTSRRGVAGTRFIVNTGHSHHHRGLKSIVDIINASELSDGAKARACKTFTLLAKAEAAVHGCAIEKVHFHEVGAVDAICDIAGAAIALEILQVDALVCAPMALGSGTVKCAHGVLPVPAPAVARLVEGVPTVVGGDEGEMTTPTGAAIVVANATGYNTPVSGTVKAVGFGSGTKEFPGHANVLQAMLLEGDDANVGRDDVAVLECNLDDMPGNRLTHLVPMLLESGALDVTIIPCTMKKNRQGMILQVLAPTTLREELTEQLLRHTPTFGVRCHLAARTILDRQIVTVETAAGPVQVKLGRHPRTKELLHIAPEYESCHAAATRSGQDFESVYAAARTAAGG